MIVVPLNPERIAMMEQLNEMLDTMSELVCDDDRIEWLDNRGWLMPTDAADLAETLIERDQQIAGLLAA